MGSESTFIITGRKRKFEISNWNIQRRKMDRAMKHGAFMRYGMKRLTVTTPTQKN